MMDGKPYYTPKEAYPIISGYTFKKKFCDLGCGVGAVVEAMKGIASEVTGIDIKPNMYLIGDFTEILPEADVYYMFVGYPKQSFDKIKHKLKGKTLLIGAHGHREIKQLERMKDELICKISVFLPNDDIYTIGVVSVIHE